MAYHTKSNAGTAVCSVSLKMAEQDGLVECFKKLYPKVDSADTPLPVSWNPKEKCNYLGLSANNLRVHYKGGISSHCLTIGGLLSSCSVYALRSALLPGPGKSLKDSASVRASHPIPAACGIYYFEVKVICKDG